MLFPTKTFSGEKTLTIGGLEVQLIEAPGETRDYPALWMPRDRTMIAGDDFQPQRSIAGPRPALPQQGGGKFIQ